MSTDQRVSFDSAPGRWVLLATVTGSGMAFLDGTVVNVALPRIGEDFDADVAGLQWTLNGYMLTLSALILLSGALGDRFGRRRVFQIGVVWFALASVACAVATSVPLLVLSRVLQGVGGALLTPGSLAIIEASFVEKDRSRAIGAWSGLTGVATAIGPFLGGWLIDAASWRWIFLLNLPLAVLTYVVAARHVPESYDPTQKGELDFAGAALATVGLAGVVYALIDAGESGWGSPSVLLTGALGIAAMAGFFWTERRSAHPMLPPDAFASRQFTAANIVTAGVYAGLGATFFLFVVFLQQVMGYDALEAGAASLPITLLMLGLSARAGQLAAQIGPRLQMSAGPLVMALATLMMTRLESGDSYFGSVFPTVVVFGLGLAATVAPLTATVLAAADDRHAGMASGINNAIARTAQLTAVAVIPLAAGVTGSAYRDPGEFTSGFHTAMLITTVLIAAGGVFAWFTIRNPEREPAREPEPCYECAFSAPGQRRS